MRFLNLNFENDIIVSEGEQINIEVWGSDADGDLLSYMVSNSPEDSEFSLAPNDKMLFQWTPGCNRGRTDAYTVDFYVTDNGTPTLFSHKSINILVIDVNTPPQLAALGNMQINEGDNLAFTVSATDNDVLNGCDNDTLTFSSTNLPAGAEFDESTGEFLWTPGYTDGDNADLNTPYKEYTVTLSVNDNHPDPQNPAGALSDSLMLTITVHNVNQPPQIDIIGDLTVKEKEKLTLKIVAQDPDGHTVLFPMPPPTRNNGNPFCADYKEGECIFTCNKDLKQCTLEWTPDYYAGNPVDQEYDITFWAEDNYTGDSNSGKASKTVTLKVLNQNRPPTAIKLEISTLEKVAVTFKLLANDPDFDEIEFIIVDKPLNGDILGTPPNLTYKPHLNYNGKDQFSFKVNDGQKDSNTALVSIEVKPVNDKPEWDLKPPAEIVAAEGKVVEFNLSARDPDIEDSISIVVKCNPELDYYLLETSKDSEKTAKFYWIPNFNSLGKCFTCEITALDTFDAKSEAASVKICVKEDTPPPFLPQPPNVSSNDWPAFRRNNTGWFNRSVGNSATTKWKIPFDAKISQSPAIDAMGNIILVTTDGMLYKIKSSGEIIGKYTVGAGEHGSLSRWIQSSPVIDKQNIYVNSGSTVNITGSSITSVFKDLSDRAWQKEFSSPLSVSNLLREDGWLYAADNTGLMFLIRASDGFIYRKGDLKVQKQISSPVVGYWGEAYTTTRDGRLIGWDPLQHYWETAESFSASRIDELKKSLLDTKKVGSIESFASSPAALISAEKKITKLFYTLNMRTKGHKCSSMLDCEQLNKTYGYNYQSCSETSDGTKICVQPISAATCEEAALKTNTPCSIYGGENWQHLTCYSKMIKDKSFCAYNAVEVYLVSAENVDGNLKYYDIEHVMTSYDKDISSSTEDIIPPTPALANDNMVYFGTPRLYSQNCQQSGNCDGYVYAYKYGNYEYNFSWKYSLQNSAVFSAPIIDKQGFVIAAGTHSGELHAIDNRGVSVWINKDSGVLKHHVYAPPAIGIDGEVYLVTENPTGKSPASYLIRYEPK